MLIIIIVISATQTQTYEIILTLGQAFEVAYQMAVQSRARQYIPPSSLHSEVVETKTSRPVCQSWSSMRRSAVSTLLQMKPRCSFAVLFFNNGIEMHHSQIILAPSKRWGYPAPLINNGTFIAMLIVIKRYFPAADVGT